MYELELANEEVKLNFFKAIVKVIKHKKQPLLPYAIKEYIRSINPNIPIYIIRPIVSRAIERLKAFSNIKIESFKSEEEAQNLCRKMINEIVDDNTDKEFENILNMYYDLCKYDKKIIIDGKEYLFNWSYIMAQWKVHNVCKTIQTVNKLCIEVLEEKEKDLKPNSYNSYLSLFNTKIKPYFTKPVSYYEPIHIDTWYKTFTDRSTLTTSEAVLRPAFEKAILKGYIKNTPFIISKPRFKSDYEINPFSLEELNIFLSSENDLLVNYLGIACFTGLRTGEILGLKWSDIDFEKEKISIQRTATAGRLQSPKTKKSKSTIDLPIEALTYFKKQRLRTGLREFVFYSRQGKNILYSSHVNNLFKKFLSSNNIEIRTIYQTRHTFASLKLSMGESAEWVSYMLRHKTLDTTYKRYYKYLPRPDEKRVVVELSLTRNRHII